MSINLTDYKDSLLFLPLGGCNEIGMNVNLYHYQGKWIMVDCGAGFADDFTPGIDMLVADLSFIRKHRKDLIALILTHAHEDHLGGVQYLFQDLDCLIYATTFTANFLKLRLEEYRPGNAITINEVKPGTKINLDPFSIEMLPLTHSAPEMQALMIRTRAGNILHTGDWKFDGNPIIGNPSDKELLKKYGEEGVTALVCDSTNVFNKVPSGSEGDLQESLIDVVRNSSGLVIATTFASNLARLNTLIVAAKFADRKIILTGRSLIRMIQAAKNSGYLSEYLSDDNIDNFIVDIDKFTSLPREKLMIISTGCQGEPLAAVNKIAIGKHQHIKLMAKDTIIFSSKIIPGNEKRIFRLFNLFIRSGIEVITEKDHFVHVSGHPSVEELKMMYELVKPKICIPVHGEPIHIHEHVKLAKKYGIEHAVEVENGTILKIDSQSTKIIGKVRTGYLGVEGNYLLPTDSRVFYMRRRMRESGIIVVTLIFNSKGYLELDPILSFPGCLDPVDDSEIITEIRRALKNQELHWKKSDIEKTTKSCIKKIIKKETNKDPIIIVNTEKL